MVLSKAVLDKIFVFTGPFEGSIPHMYLDTKGLVTTGIGFLLPTPESALKLGFMPSDHTVSDWMAVKACPAGKVASWYKSHTVCILPANNLRAEFDRRVQEFADQLSKIYKLDTYPEAAQVAVLDMAYNLGAGALIFKWPSFKAACLAKDWATAALQCKRKGVQDARNVATAALFATAAKG
jgi:GH24 family phage-related lysozyme (muramidase)